MFLLEVHASSTFLAPIGHATSMGAFFMAYP
jgi:hypothetical protein